MVISAYKYYLDLYWIAVWDNNMNLSVMAFGIVGVLFFSYIYFIKTAPMIRLRQLFAETVSVNGFKVVEDSSVVTTFYFYGNGIYFREFSCLGI